MKNIKIGKDNKVFVIAEAGSNHDGNLSQAKRLIDVAVEAGADVVKFQLFIAASLYPKNCGIVNTPIGKVVFFKLLKKLELPSGWLAEFFRYCKSKEIHFLCSVFDEKSANRFEKLNPIAYKVASSELSHLPLLRHIARYNRPIILSTGLSRLGDIEEAIEVCRQEGNNKIILMHCVTAYPTPLRDCNLNVIKTLKTAFSVPVGFSDHTLNPLIAPSVAVAIGASIIEKHFTLSRKLKGLDHVYALEPQELKEMVKQVRRIENIPMEQRMEVVKKEFGRKITDIVLGNCRKMIAPSEKKLYPCDRRSIHAIEDIEPGARLTKKNIAILRSERNIKPGISPRYWEIILNKKATRKISKWDGISWNDLLMK